MKRKLINKQIYNRLPDTLKVLTEHFEGREKDIVLLSSLGVLSNCLPNISGIYDGDTIYPNLYIMIVAPAASGKGVMNYSRLLIEKIHDQIFIDSKNDYLACEENKSTKRDKEICPSIKVKILPANISSAEMYSYLGTSNHGLLIMESEADTMSNMLKNDWSNYSDVLRKAFHHEPISISRKADKVFEDIKEPKLSMVISGTPEQLKPLIKSRENGLFSRFAIYNFEEFSDFKNVFAPKTRNIKNIFETKGEEVFDLYGKLAKLTKSVEFKFTEEQINKFYKTLKFIRTDIIDNYSEGFVSNLHRHGLILFRIAMILTVLRNEDDINDNIDELYCSNNDFIVALNIIKILLRHSQYTYGTIENGNISIQDEDLLSELKSQFSRQDIINIGSKHKVPQRTIDDKLSQWTKKRFIKKLSRGKYKKM